MCSIIVKERGVEVTPLLYAAINNIAKTHKDGLGFAIKKGGTSGVHVVKGLQNSLFCAAKLKAFHPQTDDEIMIHARTATSGERTPELTHPFIIADRQSTILAKEGQAIKTPVMAHNGILFNFIERGSKFSDTYHFIKQWLADPEILEEFQKEPALFCKKYEKTIGHNRLSFIFPKSEELMYLYGTWITDWNGLKFSNSSYLVGGKNLSASQTALINRYVENHDKRKNGTLRLFTDNPVQNAINSVFNNNKQIQIPETTMTVVKHKEEPIVNDDRKFSLALPEELLKKIEEAKQQKEEDAKKQRATDSGKSKKSTKISGSETSTLNDIGFSGNSTIVTKEISEVVDKMKNLANSRTSYIMESTFQTAIQQLNPKYLTHWLKEAIEVYVDTVTPENYHHFMFYSRNNSNYTTANTLYAITYSAFRVDAPFSIVEYKSNGDVKIPMNASQIYTYGTLIPKPRYANIYRGVALLCDSITHPSRKLLKKMTDRLLQVHKTENRVVFIEAVNSAVSIYAVEFFLNKYSNIYNPMNKGFLALDKI